MSSEPDELALALDRTLVAILREMERRLGSGEAVGIQILNLAEAYAWPQAPDQPHGGRTPPTPPRPPGGGQR